MFAQRLGKDVGFLGAGVTGSREPSGNGSWEPNSDPTQSSIHF